MLCLWKKVQDEMVDEKNITKKSKNIFLVSSQRYQDSSHLLPNPKVPLGPRGTSLASLIAHKDLLHLIIWM